MSLFPRKSASINVAIPDLGPKVAAWRVLAPKAMQRGLEAGIRAGTIEIQKRVKDLLDGPVLNRRTGRLWRSIQPEVFKRGGTVIGIVGTDVEYAAIHEFGGQIRPKSAGGFLVFDPGDGMRMVREVKMPARPYMSRAAKEGSDRVRELISDYVMRSVTGTLRTGRSVPPSQRRAVGFNA